MSSFFIIKTGTTFPSIVSEHGDFENWILKSMQDVEVKVINVENNDTFPEIKDCLGVIITGSHVMVTDELPWSLKTESFIRELVASEVPLLGICYGHQLIAKSLGGHVDFHPKGMELGTVNISTNENARNDALLHSLAENFDVHVVHSQSVLTLPKNAVLLASNDFETNHIFKIEPSTWAVQFHPEYDENIMKSYIGEVFKETAEQSEQEDVILKNVKKTTDANKIIKIFIDIAKASNLEFKNLKE